jgi:hypothetical protein
MLSFLIKHKFQVVMSDNDRVVACPTRQSPIATFGLRLTRYHKIQLGKIHVTISSIHSVYGGLPVSQTALQLSLLGGTRFNSVSTFG